MTGKQEQAACLSFLKAMLGPIVVIALPPFAPIAGISVDPLITLPLGGLVTIVITSHAKNTVEFTEFGLNKVININSFNRYWYHRPESKLPHCKSI